MILSRVIEHVKAQNWTAVALDFVIVVMGVFIGLQAQDWNTARVERAEEHEYLERLREDLAVSIMRNREQGNFMRRHAGYDTVIMNSLDHCQVAEEDRAAFANGLYHFGKITPIVLVRGAYDELISTGKLDLIKSVEVRRQLNTMFQFADEADAISKKIDARLRPHQTYVESQYVVDVREATKGAADLSPEKFDYDIAALCKDRRFITAVSSVRNLVYDAIERLDEVVVRQEETRALIERELGVAAGSGQ